MKAKNIAAIVVLTLGVGCGTLLMKTDKPEPKAVPVLPMKAKPTLSIGDSDYGINMGYRSGLREIYGQPLICTFEESGQRTEFISQLEFAQKWGEEVDLTAVPTGKDSYEMSYWFYNGTKYVLQCEKE